MQREEQSFKKLSRIAMLLSFVIFGLVLHNCTAYNPSLYPSYNVLNPDEETRKNPHGFVSWSEETQAFIINWNAGYEPDRAKTYVIIDEKMSQWIREVRDALQKEREK